MHHTTDRIAHTTAFVTPVVEHWPEREITQWVHPMKDRSDDPSHHERTLLPWSYISLPVKNKRYRIIVFVLQVDALLLVVIHSSRLTIQRKDFTRMMGDTVNLINEQTSCHQSIAEALQELKVR